MILRKRVFFFAALTSFFLAGGAGLIARAQDTSGSEAVSLGDAARKARAQKKDPNKSSKVFTNDNVGDLKGPISVIGNQPPSSSTADKSTPAGTNDKDAAKPTDKKAAPDAKKPAPKDEAYWRAKFAAARKTLADDSKELDILQREYNLKLTQYSQDPNWAMHEQYSRDDVNKTQSQIDAKKQDVDKDKQAVADLEDELRKSGGEPGWASEPSGGSSN